MSGAYWTAWLRLTRAQHALISAAGVLAAMLAMGRAGFSPAPVVWAAAMAVPILINLGAFALNDYFDIETDRHNGHHHRPLVSGAIPPLHAAAGGSLLLAAGGLAGFLISPLAGAVSAGFALFSLLYNRILKDWPLVGNLFIALSMAVSFIFGVVAVGGSLGAIPYDILVLTGGAVCAGLGREIVKTVQDMAGDKAARGSRALPHWIGADWSLRLAAALFLAYIAFAIALGAWAQILRHNLFSLGLLGLSSYLYATLAVIALRGPGAEQLEAIRKTSLIGLGMALLAVILASL